MLLNKKTLMIAFTILMINHLSANEPLCTPNENCFNFENIESQIYLIERSETSPWTWFEMYLMDYVEKEKIIYLAEAQSVQRAKDSFYNIPYFFREMENALINSFLSLVDYTNTIYKINSPSAPTAFYEQFKYHKTHVIDLMLFDAKALELWTDFKNSNEIKNIDGNLVSLFNNIIDNKKHPKLKVSKAYDQLYHLPDSQWLDLFKYFPIYILNNHIAKLPQKFRPDIQKIRNFFENSSNDDFVLKEFNSYLYHWKNLFIQENIKNAYKFAQTVAKPIFMIVSQHNFKHTETFLKKLNYPFKSYSIQSGSSTLKDKLEF